MNKNIAKFIKVGMVVLLMLSLLTACSKEEKQRNVVLINGENINSSKIDRDIQEKYLYEVCRYGGNISYMLANPSTDNTSVKIESPTSRMSEANKKRLANSRLDEVSKKLEIQPTMDEVDIMAALTKASKISKGMEDTKIVVFTNLLNTAGVLDMTEVTVDDLDIETTIDNLEEQKLLPDLSNKEVMFVILSQKNNQKPLSYATECKLISLWQEIVERSGGKFEYLYAKDNIEDGTGDLKVSTVKSVQPEKCIDVEDIDSLDEQMTVDVLKRGVSIGENAIEFVPNTAELKDEDQAIQTLTYVAELIRENRIQCSIVASTATVGEKEGAIELSNLRGDCIKHLLVEKLNVDANLLEVRGYGYDESNPFFSNDIDDKGNLIQEIASNNRKIVILDKAEFEQKLQQ